jgi:hypothetical protein
MQSLQWKLQRMATFMILAMLGAMTLTIVTIPKTLAQIPPSVNAKCTDVEIQKHIQQLNKGEETDFNALVLCGSSSVPALIKSLKNKDENFLIITIAALGEIGAEAKPAVPVLRGLLEDKRVNIRIFAADALGKILHQVSVETIDTAQTTYLINNPPAMCKIPAIKAVLSWKCPEDLRPQKRRRRRENR